MPSGHAKLGRLAQDSTPVGVHEHEIAVSIEVRAPFRLQRQREATHLGCRAGVHGHGGGVVEIEDRDVARALPGHDVLLGRDVRVARAMVIEVVLKDIGDDRDVRAVRERLQLEA